MERMIYFNTIHSSWMMSPAYVRREIAPERKTKMFDLVHRNLRLVTEKLHFSQVCSHMFEFLFRYLSAKIETGPMETKLQLKDELLFVLMKSRLNLCFEDLADRFNIAKGTASKIFHN